MRGSNTFFKALNSVPLFGVVLFTFSVAFPPFDDATALDLSIHMLQHVLIVISGVLISHPLYKRGHFSTIEGKRAGSMGLLIVVALITFWHLSGPWDAAVLNPLVHAGEHLSFLTVGFLIGSLLQMLADESKIQILVLGFVANFAYGLVLISSYHVYPLYSLGQQATLGLIMFIAGPGYWTGIIYLILRNPRWFRENQSFEPAPKPKTEHSSKLRRFRFMIPTLTILLIAIFVGYYATGVAAISFASGQQPLQGSVVYIQETPVSWQYSPQNIRVVIGINNTVTWISHSISYDTVTGVNGSFSSGPIAPGRTFAHTFTQPGKYEYYCIYHPWMVGSVTVLAGPT